MATTASEAPGASRAYLIGHPETRGTTVIAVTATISSLLWAAIIVLVMLTTTHVVSSDAPMIELVGMLIGLAVLAGVAAIVSLGAHVIQIRMCRNQQELYEAVDDSRNTYEQAICDLVTTGGSKLVAIPRQRL